MRVVFFVFLLRLLPPLLHGPKSKIARTRTLSVSPSRSSDVERFSAFLARLLRLSCLAVLSGFVARLHTQRLSNCWLTVERLAGRLRSPNFPTPKNPASARVSPQRAVPGKAFYNYSRALVVTVFHEVYGSSYPAVKIRFIATVHLALMPWRKKNPETEIIFLFPRPSVPDAVTSEFGNWPMSQGKISGGFPCQFSKIIGDSGYSENARTNRLRETFRFDSPLFFFFAVASRYLYTTIFIYTLCTLL